MEYLKLWGIDWIFGSLAIGQAVQSQYRDIHYTEGRGFSILILIFILYMVLYIFGPLARN